MTFRTKLLLLSSFTAAGAVALVTGAVSLASRQMFEQTDGERRTEMLAQLQHEFASQSAQIARIVEREADSGSVERMIDGSAEYDQAQREAAAAGLDYLDVLQPDLTIISSAHWPARFGYRNDWPIDPAEWMKSTGEIPAFLTRVPLSEGGFAPALLVARTRADGRAKVVGGRRVTPDFLKSLGQAPGLHTLLWIPPGDAIDARGESLDLTKLTSLVGRTRDEDKPATGVIQWKSARSSAEDFLAAPLPRRGTTMGVLFAGTSLAAEFNLENRILWIGVVVALCGIVIGVLLGWWTSERVTRPVTQLAEGARAVAAGDWSSRVNVASNDEIGELAAAFNRMTVQLVEQRDRAIQAERVAAWRELARRLAHELKNPLFPLQITIENLKKARKLSDDEFAVVFNESTDTLLAELANLKLIVGRFSDFAKMPPPRFDHVDLNDIVRGVVKLYGAQLQANGRPAIVPHLDLSEGPLQIHADEDQLRRAIGNLVLNAIDAMPQGGDLRVASAGENGHARLSISDTGHGLTEEECARLFTPYYTTKQHGTGLGLAIVQSVVSDHGGKISVESRPGQGATFLIELPASQGTLS